MMTTKKFKSLLNRQDALVHSSGKLCQAVDIPVFFTEIKPHEEKGL